MKIWVPVYKRGKTTFLGPYRYNLSEMVSPKEKVIELLRMGAFFEIEEQKTFLGLPKKWIRSSLSMLRERNSTQGLNKPKS